MVVQRVNEPDPSTVVTRNRFIINDIIPLYLRNTKMENRFILTFHCKEDHDDKYIFLEIMMIIHDKILKKNFQESFLNIESKKFSEQTKNLALIEEAKISEDRYVTDLHMEEDDNYRAYFHSVAVKAIDHRHNKVLDLYIPRDNFIKIQKFLKDIDEGINENKIIRTFFSPIYHNLKFYDITRIDTEGTLYSEKPVQMIVNGGHIYFTHYTMYSEIEKFRLNCISISKLPKEQLMNPMHECNYIPNFGDDFCVTDFFKSKNFLYIIYDPLSSKDRSELENYTSYPLYVLKLTPRQYMATAFGDPDFIFEKS